MPAKHIKHFEVCLPQGYVPTLGEKYMNDFQIEFFRTKLISARTSLQEELENLNRDIYSSANTDGDSLDKASHETILFSKVKRLDSIQKTINEIDDSLEMIQLRKYGFCKKTGKEIGIKRLLIQPEAKFCVEAQESIEQAM